MLASNHSRLFYYCSCSWIFELNILSNLSKCIFRSISKYAELIYTTLNKNVNLQTIFLFIISLFRKTQVRSRIPPAAKTKAERLTFLLAPTSQLAQIQVTVWCLSNGIYFRISIVLISSWKTDRTGSHINNA